MRVLPDAAALADGVARAFLDLVAEVQSLSPDRVARVVLTGGTIADAVHRRIRELADPRPSDEPRDEPSAEAGPEPSDRAVDWSRIDWWWGDERFVPADSADRNAGQARRALLDHVPVDEDRVHEMPSVSVTGSDLSLSVAAQQYADELSATVAGGRFDLVMLGIGPDGHVASLFPHHAALTAVGDTVAVPDSPKPPPERVSLTFARLNTTDRVWILASGESKRDATDALLAPAGAPGATVEETPARGVHGLTPTALTLWTDLPQDR